MKAAYYRGYGAARDVFEVGELPDPEPGPGEVRVASVIPASTRRTAIAAAVAAIGPAIR